LIEPSAFWVLHSKESFRLTPQMLAEQEFLQTLTMKEVSEEQLVEFASIAGLVSGEVDPRTQPQWIVWSEHRQSLRIGDIEFRHEDNIERIHKFDKPVLLVKGEGSNSNYHEIADELSGEFPKARVVTFPGGHAPHLVSKRPFLEEFARFLSERDTT
jgi:pimeloyl-ACP methyl ester carboxylesterase